MINKQRLLSMAYYDFDGKKVHYEIQGIGPALILLHGNTASSMMFKPLVDLYSMEFRVILIDFPGHGKSERVTKFNSDFWFYNSRVCLALLDELKIDKVIVAGASGGALVGINLALESPERIEYLFADSFMGHQTFAKQIGSLKEEREKGKKQAFTKGFWKLNHGADWETVVDMDTHMLVEFYTSGRSFFHRSLSDLVVPTLLTGSLEDKLCPQLSDDYQLYIEGNTIFQTHIFDKGGHPSILSNSNEFYDVLKKRVGLSNAKAF